MNKLLAVALVAWSLLAIVPAISSAQEQDQGRRLEASQTRLGTEKKLLKSNWKRWEYNRGEQVAEVPELDGGIAPTGLALLLAASALLLERRRTAAQA